MHFLLLVISGALAGFLYSDITRHPEKITLLKVTQLTVIVIVGIILCFN